MATTTSTVALWAEVVPVNRLCAITGVCDPDRDWFCHDCRRPVQRPEPALRRWSLVCEPTALWLRRVCGPLAVAS